MAPFKSGGLFFTVTASIAAATEPPPLVFKPSPPTVVLVYNFDKRKEKTLSLKKTVLELQLEAHIASVKARNKAATQAILAIGRKLERDGQFCGSGCKSHAACRES